MKNFLALDYGTKKTGIAYSVGNFCFAYKTVKNEELFKTLQKVIIEKKIEKIIIGMPYNIDGTLSVHAKRVQKFSKKLDILSLPIELYDERLSTSEARIAVDEFDFYGDLDAESARIILENYLEKK